MFQISVLWVRIKMSYYYIIGNHIWGVQLYHHNWRWVTLNGQSSNADNGLKLIHEWWGAVWELTKEINCFNLQQWVFSSALCYYTAELLPWRWRPSSVSSSEDIVFSDTTKRITCNIKFGGKVPIHHISRPLFLFFKNFTVLIFYDFFFRFL